MTFIFHLTLGLALVSLLPAQLLFFLSPKLINISAQHGKVKLFSPPFSLFEGKVKLLGGRFRRHFWICVSKQISITLIGTSLFVNTENWKSAKLERLWRREKSLERGNRGEANADEHKFRNWRNNHDGKWRLPPENCLKSFQKLFGNWKGRRTLSECRFQISFFLKYQINCLCCLSSKHRNSSQIILGSKHSILFEKLSETFISNPEILLLKAILNWNTPKQNLSNFFSFSLLNRWLRRNSTNYYSRKCPWARLKLNILSLVWYRRPNIIYNFSLSLKSLVSFWHDDVGPRGNCEHYDKVSK